MRILFISSSNAYQGIDSLILNQAISLEKIGYTVNHFLVYGGVKSYLKSIKQIRIWLERNPVDIIHAHYGLCGLVAVFAGNCYAPVVISFMGSDLHGGSPKRITDFAYILINKISSLIVQFFSRAIITKSANLQKLLIFKKKSSIIPNGINCIAFTPRDRRHSQIQLGLPLNNKYILFLGNINDNNKNFGLLKQLVFNQNIRIITPYPISSDDVIAYINAADVLVLVSLKEGSPNVIKEAMACNCPIVSTDVGDVRWVFGETEGCYICSFDPEDVAEKIEMALEFSRTKGRTNGRQRILELGLDSESIAKRLLAVYEKVVRGKGYRVTEEVTR